MLTPSLTFLKERCKKIHYFGLGFIQVKVSDTERYHFYTNKWPATNEEPHTHRYEFRSRILKGSLLNTVYTVCAGDEYEKMRVSCDPANPLKDLTNEFVGAFPSIRMSLVAGSVYIQRPELFHTVKGYGAITHIQRPSEEGRSDFAEVLKARHRPRVCPFSTVIPESDLWAEVEKMLSE